MNYRRTLFLLMTIISSTFLAAQNNHLHIGQKPPKITFTDLNSQKFIEYNYNKMKGSVYLIDFWATWCAPCIETIPHIDSLIEEFKGKNVKVVSITYEPEDKVKRFLQEHELKSEVGIDTGFTMFKRYNAWAIPNIVMINSKGIIAGRIHPSRLTGEIIKNLIKGGIPSVENTPENLFDPNQAEQYFRSYLDEKKNEKH